MKKVDSSELYDGIRLLILSARQAVARGVNLLQVHTNYEIGRRIVEREQGGADRAQYGKEVIKELAERLTSDFGNGFSKSNLEYMRRFYLAYPGRNIQIAQTASGRFVGLEKGTLSSIAQTLSGQSASSGEEPSFTLSWSHYVFLLGLKDEERRFYEIEAAEQGWTLRDLKRQFNAGASTSDSRLAETKRRSMILLVRVKVSPDHKTYSRSHTSSNFSAWKAGSHTLSLISKRRSSITYNIFCWSLAKVSSSRRARNASRSTKNTSSSIWFSTIAC
jgi:hypothetical protein